MLCHGETRLESKGKRKSASSLCNRETTLDSCISPPLSKCRMFSKNHRKSKTSLPFSHPPLRTLHPPTIFLLYFPVCKRQPGLNAGGPRGIGHIAPFLPCLSNRNATDSGDQAWVVGETQNWSS